MTSHEELRERLREAIEASTLAEHVELLMARARPVFHAVRVGGAPALGTSKLCGVADLPEGATWPTHEHGPYEFVAQINFADLAGADVGLPSDGLLSVFAATDPAEAYFWQDPEYVRLLYSAAGTPLVPTPAPPPSSAQVEPHGDLPSYEARMRPPPLAKAGVAVRFKRGIELPRSIDQGGDWPLEGHVDSDAGFAFEDAMQAIVESVSPQLSDGVSGQPSEHGAIGDDHLLGYPGVSSLGYDPTPEGDWIPLLGLWSHEDLGWCWHDGDYLHIAIERSKLAAKDFSNVASDAG